MYTLCESSDNSQMACYNLDMKLIRTFEITSDEFYDYLEAQLLEEISKTTKKNVKKSVIKSGYSYENKDARSKIVIDKYVRGQIYQSTVKSATSFVRVCYETQETKEGLKISFEQFMSGEEKLPQKMFYIVHGITGLHLEECLTFYMICVMILLRFVTAKRL